MNSHIFRRTRLSFAEIAFSILAFTAPSLAVAGTVTYTSIMTDVPSIDGDRVVLTRNQLVGDVQIPTLDIYDISTGNITSTGVIGHFPDISGDRIAFRVVEGELGQDLNGDGQISWGDTFLGLYEISATTSSASAQPGGSATVSVAPQVAGQSGVSATLTNNTSGTSIATVTVETLNSNPTGENVFDVGGGFVDLHAGGVDASDTVSASFYYPSTLTGSQEDTLVLLYFDGSTWELVLSSGALAPTKDTTDNLDSTISGGRFSVVFDATSEPAVTQLTGTVFTITKPECDGLEATIVGTNGRDILTGTGIHDVIVGLGGTIS